MLINATSAIQNLETIRGALKIINVLYLTTNVYPKQTCVHNELSFDYIVIGGGTSGCVIASRLAEDPKTTVLLIESGDYPQFESNMPGLLMYIKESQAAWNYTIEDDEIYRRYHRETIDDLALGRALGGTSSAGYIIYNPGNHYDYDSWARTVNDSTWNWQNILPYLKKSQKLVDEELLSSDNGKLYGKDGKIGLSLYRMEFRDKFFPIFEQAGHSIVPSFNGNIIHGYTDAMYTINDGIRQSTAFSYLTPMKNSTNLHILTKTVVKKIIFDESKNAIGVEIETCEGKHMIIKSRIEIILSAGIINSPKLLMLSGIGPKEHLREHNIKLISDLPVGENLQDHLSTVIVFNMTNLVIPYRPWNLHNYPASLLVGFASINNTVGYPHYHVINFINYPKYLMMYCTFTYGYTNEVCDEMIKTEVNSVMMYSVVSLQKFKSKGRILLRSSYYKDKPKFFNGNTDEDDREEHANAVLHFMKIKNTKQFEELGGQFKDPNLEECNRYKKFNFRYWKCYVKYLRTSLHNYSSTCAMGTVVDSRLRVYGVKRLRVADACVMPSPTAGGTLGATIVIGEKAADMIKEDNLK